MSEIDIKNPQSSKVSHKGRNYAEGLSIPKIARIMGRSPATVSHYLKFDQRMGRKNISTGIKILIPNPDFPSLSNMQKKQK